MGALIYNESRHLLKSSLKVTSYIIDLPHVYLTWCSVSLHVFLTQLMSWEYCREETRALSYQANDDTDMLDWLGDRKYAVKLCKLSQMCTVSNSHFAIQKWVMTHWTKTDGVQREGSVWAWRHFTHLLTDQTSNTKYSHLYFQFLLMFLSFTVLKKVLVCIFHAKTRNC